MPTINKSNTQTTIFLLDYDGCTDILFSDKLFKILENNLRADPFYSLYKRAFPRIKESLSTFLDQKASESTNPVEVYDNSARQSQHLDEALGKQNGNGFCLKNFKNFCDAKGWVLRDVLLADVFKKNKIEKAWNNSKLDCPLLAEKTSIVRHKLNDIEKNHRDPKEKINVYILDDNPFIDNITSPLDYPSNTIFQKLKENLWPSMISENISIHMIKFDWFAALIRGETQFTDFGTIQGTKKIVSKAPASSIGLFQRLCCMVDSALPDNSTSYRTNRSN